MKKSCQLDQTLELPPIGAKVLIHDDDEIGLPHPGTVCGHGTTTRAGCTIDPTTPLVPTVLVHLDRGEYLDPGAIPSQRRQRCHVSVIAVHPDNLARDEYGNYTQEVGA